MTLQQRKRLPDRRETLTLPLLVQVPLHPAPARPRGCAPQTGAAEPNQRSLSSSAKRQKFLSDHCLDKSSIPVTRPTNSQQKLNHGHHFLIDVCSFSNLRVNKGAFALFGLRIDSRQSVKNTSAKPQPWINPTFAWTQSDVSHARMRFSGTSIPDDVGCTASRYVAAPQY